MNQKNIIAVAIVTAGFLSLSVPVQAADAVFRYDSGTIAYTSATAVAAGDVVCINSSNLLAVAKSAIAVGSVGTVYTRGVFDFAKDASPATAIGAAFFWNPTGNPYGTTDGTGCATTNFQAGVYLGYCVETAATNDATVRVVLNGRDLVKPPWPTSDPGFAGAIWVSNGVMRVSQ